MRGGATGDAVCEHRSASPSGVGGGRYMRVCLELGLPLCLYFVTCTLHLN